MMHHHCCMYYDTIGTLPTPFLETSQQQLPTIYAITPTYARATQRVDLISLCHTLMHVPKITWIVVEDSVDRTQTVKNLLARQCKSVTSIHLTAKTSSNVKGGGKGINQRNAGLSWIRQNCRSSNNNNNNNNNTTVSVEKKCRGVVYLMDDDNKYDLRLFQEVGHRNSY